MKRPDNTVPGSFILFQKSNFIAVFRLSLSQTVPYYPTTSRPQTGHETGQEPAS